MPGNYEHIILFDGVCNLCSGIVTFIIKRDPKAKFKFASLQSEIGKEYLNSNKLPITNLDTIVYIRKQKVLTKSLAALFVLKDLGRFWKFCIVFIIIPRFIRDFFYSIIAKSRYKIWGKKDTCLIPTPEIKDRFIDQ